MNKYNISQELLQKYSKQYAIGTSVDAGDVVYNITTPISKFKDCHMLYADSDSPDALACACYELESGLALILRNPAKLHEAGFTSSERRAIYCHELGHIFSPNQKHSTTRNAFDEVDADTFAVIHLDTNPDILYSALKKTYEHHIANLDTNMTQEKFDSLCEEMSMRKHNAIQLQEIAKKKNIIKDR